MAEKTVYITLEEAEDHTQLLNRILNLLENTHSDEYEEYYELREATERFESKIDTAKND